MKRTTSAQSMRRAQAAEAFVGAAAAAASVAAAAPLLSSPSDARCSPVSRALAGGRRGLAVLVGANAAAGGGGGGGDLRSRVLKQQHALFSAGKAPAPAAAAPAAAEDAAAAPALRLFAGAAAE